MPIFQVFETGIDIWSSHRIRDTCRPGSGAARVNKCEQNYLTLYVLTPWSTVLLKNLTDSQLIKKFPAFHGTRRFITAFTSAGQLSLSWSNSIQSIPLHPTSWTSILILSSLLRFGVPILIQLYPVHTPTSKLLKIQLNIILLSTPWSPNRSLSFKFPHQIPVYVFLLRHTRYMPRPSNTEIHTAMRGTCVCYKQWHQYSPSFTHNCRRSALSSLCWS